MTTETNIVLPSSPADIKKIKEAIHEIAVAYQKIADQNSHIKDIIDMIKEDFTIPPKHTRKMARVYFKGSFKDTQAESEEFELLFETVIGADEQ